MNGGASTGTDLPLRAMKGKSLHYGKSQQPFNASGIYGDPLSQEREEVSPEGCGVKLGEGRIS